MAIDSATLKKSLWSVSLALLMASAELNTLDGKLGDGDLGATLEKCARNIMDAIPSMNDDLSNNFKAAALACAKASGSSFGTLLAQGLLVAARDTLERKALTHTDIAELVSASVQALSARGGAVLGDKTVLDAMDSAACALKTASDGNDFRAVAAKAIKQTISTFRDKPNKIGRARMFAERSIGMDDPGMIAFLRIVEAV
ncbi:DAK2 domain-containing protein [Paraburkholderia sediminicola]|uniref:DAK2 domain-containing protein n=1 Tax=Paraburkholderia TaxID=1822464 RepID=UPI0038B88757